MRHLARATRRAGRAALLIASVLAVLALALSAWLWLVGPQADEGAQIAAPQQTRPQGSAVRLANPSGADGSAGGDASTAQRLELAAEVDAEDRRIDWRGEVDDAATGSPIADALVTLSLDERSAEVRTDEDGGFALSWPAELGARLAIQHPGYVDVRAPEVDLTREGAFALHRSATLRGRIDPTPDSGEARAMAWLVSSSSQRSWEALEAPVHSDGTFELSDLDPGDYVVAAIVPELSVAPQAGLHLERGETLDLVLRAEPAAQVAGVVLRMPAERGLPGARVSASPQRYDELPRQWSRAVSSETTSDERGRYVLTGLGPGSWRIEAVAPWGARMVRNLDVPESGERIELDLQVAGPAMVTGRVSDADGRGVEGARVVAVTDWRLSDLERLAAGDGGASSSTITSADGAFALEQVPAQVDVVLVAVAPRTTEDESLRFGFSNLPRLEPTGTHTGVEILLEGRGELHGRVLGPEGEIVAGATIQALARPGRLRGELRPQHSDEEGRFVFRGLPQVGLFLRAEHPDWLGSWVQVDPAAGSEEVELRMRPAFAIEGLAVDTQGFAVEGLRVRVEDSSGSSEEVNRLRSRGLPGATTDAYGHFRIAGLGEGSWIIAGSSYEWQQVESLPAVVSTPGDAFVTLTFAPRERPLRAEIRGEIALAEGGTPSGVRIEGLRGGVLTVDGGRFRATGLVPTRHRLTLRADGHAPVRTEAIDLPPGQVHDLGRIELLAAAEVVVHVQDEQGRPLNGARVRLTPLPRSEGGAGEGSGGLSLRGGRRGRYSTEEATLHAWRLVVDREGFQRKVRRVEIGSQERVQIEVRLEPRGSGG